MRQVLKYLGPFGARTRIMLIISAGERKKTRRWEWCLLTFRWFVAVAALRCRKMGDQTKLN